PCEGAAGDQRAADPGAFDGASITSGAGHWREFFAAGCAILARRTYAGSRGVTAGSTKGDGKHRQGGTAVAQVCRGGASDCRVRRAGYWNERQRLRVSCLRQRGAGDEAIGDATATYSRFWRHGFRPAFDDRGAS